MQQALFMAFDKRLAGFLLEEMSSENTETIVMTHEQIANHLGSAREVVSRMLKLFAADGIVEVSRKGITVKDKSKLRKIAY
jgi:CRP/FNR family transcriptional regulator